MFDRFADRLRDRFKKDAGSAPPPLPPPPPEEAAPVAPPPAESTPAAPRGLMQRLKQEWDEGVADLKKDVDGLGKSFNRLRDGLKRTREGLVSKAVELFRGGRRIDEDFWESLEEILITSDAGVETSTRLVERLRQTVKQQRLTEPPQLLEVLRQEVSGILQGAQSPLRFQEQPPTVIMVVGVNGTGKTTTIGKLAHRLKSEGKKVMLAAADTFRAAAIDQLQVWSDRVGVDLIRLSEGADPAAVAFDAVQAAQARGADVLIVDTAGRLHNKVNLMEELKKVRRVISRQMPDAPHETLLVLDATTGQNALAQARTFGAAVDVTGLVLAKLDGTARGGIVIAIAEELGIPVKFIGIGEGVDDLRPFDADEFVAALFATDASGVAG